MSVKEFTKVLDDFIEKQKTQANSSGQLKAMYFNTQIRKDITYG